MSIKAVVADFANRLQALIEEHSLARARAAVLSAFGVQPARGPGRPPTAAKLLVGKVASRKARKKAPRQLCPVPGCKNPAAPIFGMVCAKHKDVAKAKIKQYREARKAKKLGGKAGKRVEVKAAPVARKAAPPRKKAAPPRKKAAPPRKKAAPWQQKVIARAPTPTGMTSPPATSAPAQA